MKDHVPQKQHAPAVRTEAAHRNVGLVAGLADLAALRLVAAFPPTLLELHVIYAAPLFRVHLLGEVHRLLLEQDGQGNDHQEDHQQQDRIAIGTLGQLFGAGIEKEEADDHRQAVQQQRPAQALLRPLHHVLILAVPAAEGGSGFAVLNADYLYDELVKRNIPAIIMEPLLGGRLSNVPTHIMTRLKQRRPEDSVASWAFRFAGSPELVLTVLSGMTYMEHLQDNIRTYSPLIPLTDDDKEFLEETAQLMLKYPTVPCNDCKYCMPCPYGIDIPAVLIHYNKCVNEGNVPKSQQDENYRKARQAFLVGYDRSVPRLRQANHCIGCDQCSPHCPQSINIPRELRRIDGFVEQLKQETL